MNAVQLQETFSSNLKELRTRANLTQMKLAEISDLSVGYICDLESGRRWGTPETFSKLAGALGVNPYELLIPKGMEFTALDVSFQHKFESKLQETVQKNIKSALNSAISQAIAESKK